MYLDTVQMQIGAKIWDSTVTEYFNIEHIGNEISGAADMPDDDLKIYRKYDVAVVLENCVEGTRSYSAGEIVLVSPTIRSREIWLSVLSIIDSDDPENRDNGGFEVYSDLVHPIYRDYMMVLSDSIDNSN